jgi:uncharacterized membrane protein
MKRFACLCVFLGFMIGGRTAQADGYDYEILSQPGQLTTEAQDFNSAGDVVGLSQTPEFQLRPFVYRNGRFIPLDGVPTNPPILSLSGINDAGRMIGFVNRLDLTVTSALLDAAGVIRTIAVPGAIETYAYSINNKDQIAGSYTHRKGGSIFVTTSAFRYDAARGYRRFDAPDASGLTIAWGLNNSGIAVGVYADREFIYHGFVRRPDGTISRFDVPGSPYTQLMGLNDRGDIVGLYQDSAGAIRGFCQCDGRFVPLQPTADTEMTYPYNIDNNGRIVGWFISNTGTYGFVATPR